MNGDVRRETFGGPDAHENATDSGQASCLPSHERLAISRRWSDFQSVCANDRRNAQAYGTTNQRTICTV